MSVIRAIIPYGSQRWNRYRRPAVPVRSVTGPDFGLTGLPFDRFLPVELFSLVERFLPLELIFFPASIRDSYPTLLLGLIGYCRLYLIRFVIWVSPL